MPFHCFPCILTGRCVLFARIALLNCCFACSSRANLDFFAHMLLRCACIIVHSPLPSLSFFLSFSSSSSILLWIDASIAFHASHLPRNPTPPNFLYPDFNSPDFNNSNSLSLYPGIKFLKGMENLNEKTENLLYSYSACRKLLWENIQADSLSLGLGAFYWYPRKKSNKN